MDWRDISRKVVDERAVFIVGVPRSGTSILYKTLQSLPEFATKVETGKVDLTETRIFSGLLIGNLASETIGDTNSRAFAYYLRDASAWRAFCKNVAALRRWQAGWQKMLARSGRMTRLFQASAGRGGLFWRLGADPHILRSFFYYATQARQSVRIIEKTPGHLQHLPKIRATFPRSAIIAMVRQPVEVFASHRKRYARELAAGTSPTRLAWLEQTPEQFCEMYGGMVAHLQTNLQASRAAVLVVKYETLTKERREELSKICQFIGSTYSDSLLSDNEVIVGGHRADAANIDQMLAKPIQTRANNWREHMSRETALEIEARLKSEMAWLGYESVVEDRG